MRQNPNQNFNNFEERSLGANQGRQKLQQSSFLVGNSRQARIHKTPYQNSQNSQYQPMDLGSQANLLSQSSRNEGSFISNIATKLVDKVKGWTTNLIFGSQKSLSSEEKRRRPYLSQSQMAIDEELKDEIDLNESIILKDPPTMKMSNISIIPYEVVKNTKLQYKQSSDKQVKNDSTRISQNEPSLEYLLNNDDSNPPNLKTNTLSSIDTQNAGQNFMNPIRIIELCEQKKKLSKKFISHWECYNNKEFFCDELPTNMKSYALFKSLQLIAKGKRQRKMTTADNVKINYKEFLTKDYKYEPKKPGEKQIYQHIHKPLAKRTHNQSQFIFGERRKYGFEPPVQPKNYKFMKKEDDLVRGSLSLKTDDIRQGQEELENKYRINSMMSLKDKEDFKRGFLESKRKAEQQNDPSIMEKFMNNASLEILKQIEEQKLQNAKLRIDYEKNMNFLKTKNEEIQLENRRQQREIQQQLKSLKDLSSQKLDESMQSQQQMIQKLMKEMAEQLIKAQEQLSQNVIMSQSSQQSMLSQDTKLIDIIQEQVKGIQNQIQNISTQQSKLLNEIAQKQVGPPQSIQILNKPSDSKSNNGNQQKLSELEQLLESDEKKSTQQIESKTFLKTNSEEVKKSKTHNEPNKTLSFGGQSSEVKKDPNLSNQSSFISENISTPTSNKSKDMISPQSTMTKENTNVPKPFSIPTQPAQPTLPTLQLNAQGNNSTTTTTSSNVIKFNPILTNTSTTGLNLNPTQAPSNPAFHFNSGNQTSTTLNTNQQKPLVLPPPIFPIAQTSTTTPTNNTIKPLVFNPIQSTTGVAQPVNSSQPPLGNITNNPFITQQQIANNPFLNNTSGSVKPIAPIVNNPFIKPTTPTLQQNNNVPNPFANKTITPIVLNTQPNPFNNGNQMNNNNNLPGFQMKPPQINNPFQSNQQTNNSNINMEVEGNQRSQQFPNQQNPLQNNPFQSKPAFPIQNTQFNQNNSTINNPFAPKTQQQLGLNPPMQSQNNFNQNNPFPKINTTFNNNMQQNSYMSGNSGQSNSGGGGFTLGQSKAQKQNNNNDEDDGLFNRTFVKAKRNGQR